MNVITCLEKSWVVRKCYNQKQATLQSKTTGVSYLAHKDLFSEPTLSLAHVSKDHTTLRKKEREIQW